MAHFSFNKPAFSKYLTFSDRDVAWQIYCTCVGYSKIPPGAPHYPYRPKLHPPGYVFDWEKGRILNEYQIVYITKGRGMYKSEETEKRNIIEGDTMLVFPGVRHTYRPFPEAGWDEYWVGFRGAYPDTLIENGFLTAETPVLHTGLHEILIDSFHELFEIAQREPPHFQLKMGGAIIKLIARMLSLSEQEKQGSKVESLVQKARFLLDEHIYNHLEMNDFARQLNTDYPELRKIFKSYTGMSPYQYFLHLKINKAKDLLAQKEYSVKEIAYMLSFENQYYFSRLFKTKTGVPPSQWHG